MIFRTTDITIDKAFFFFKIWKFCREKEVILLYDGIKCFPAMFVVSILIWPEGK